MARGGGLQNGQYEVAPANECGLGRICGVEACDGDEFDSTVIANLSREPRGCSELDNVLFKYENTARRERVRILAVNVSRCIC